MLGYVRRWLTRGRLGLRERHNQLDTIVQAEERLSIAAPPVYKLFRLLDFPDPKIRLGCFDSWRTLDLVCCLPRFVTCHYLPN